MKVAPIYRAMAMRDGFDPVLVHTGQHFDEVMSGAFIDALQLPTPDIALEVRPGTQAQQAGEILQRLERVLEDERPDITVVVGDVTSTVAAALASSMAGVRVAHVEAGLRSRDWTMPEERNRVLTDRLSTLLFTHSPEAEHNLAAEGILDGVHFVGNVMIDSLDWILPHVKTTGTLVKHGVAPGRFALVTLHRPGNVDEHQTLERLVQALGAVSRELPVLFPVHPRTRAALGDLCLGADLGDLRLMAPLGYTEFIALLSQAAVVLTDSGGIQEEAVVLGTPCLTLRDNTERPVTLELGNELVGRDPERIVAAALRDVRGGRREQRRPDLWDGHAAERIVDTLAAWGG